jgi:hypothetical protein
MTASLQVNTKRFDQLLRHGGAVFSTSPSTYFTTHSPGRVAFLKAAFVSFLRWAVSQNSKHGVAYQGDYGEVIQIADACMHWAERVCLFRWIGDHACN